MEEGRFETRLRCAVSAVWMTLLIGFVWLLFAWGWWMIILRRPGLTRFAEAIWGGATVAEMKPTVWLFLGVMKMVLFVCALGVICLHLWYRKLKKATG